MARWRRSYRRARRSFRASSYRTRSYGKNAMGGLSNPKFLLGVGAGVLAPNIVPYQDLAITALAVLPVPKMGLGAPARGYVIGRIARGLVPALGGLAGGAGGSGGDYA